MKPEQALDRVRAAQPGLELAGELHSGPVSRSYLLTAGGQQFVMRVDEPLAALLQLDRRTEYEISRYVAGFGLGPPMVACDPGPPVVMLRQFIPGRSWTPEDLLHRDPLKRLAALLRHLHRIPPIPVAPIGLIPTVVAYGEILGTPAADTVRRALMLMRDAATVEASYCLCHHDPIASNVIGSEAPRLIDWEYARLGDPLFDLAVVIQHHDMSAENAGAFVKFYFGKMPDGFAWDKLAKLRELYDCLALMWLQIVDKETGLSGNLLQKLRETEHRLDARP